MIIINTTVPLSVAESEDGKSLKIIYDYTGKDNPKLVNVNCDEVGPGDAPLTFGKLIVYFSPGSVQIKDSASDQTHNNGTWWIEEY